MRSGYGSSVSLELRKNEVSRIIKKWKSKGGAGKRVLDVGCGIGNFTDILSSFEYFGIDYSSEALREHRENHKKPVVLADAQSMPFKDKAFDVCIAVEVSQYMDDHTLFMSELARVLKPGGVCIVISPNPESLFWLLRKKVKGKSPLNFIGIKKLIDISPFRVRELGGIFPLPPFGFAPALNGFINILLGFSARLSPVIPLEFIRRFSKSFVVVFER